MTVYVAGDIHGGLDMQKLRGWELGDSLGNAAALELIDRSRNDGRAHFLTPTNPRSRSTRYNVDFEMPVAAQMSVIGVSQAR